MNILNSMQHPQLIIPIYLLICFLNVPLEWKKLRYALWGAYIGMVPILETLWSCEAWSATWMLKPCLNTPSLPGRTAKEHKDSTQTSTQVIEIKYYLITDINLS